MEKKKTPQLNFNSLIGIIAVGAIGWNGTMTAKLVQQVSRLEVLAEVASHQQDYVEKRITVLEAIAGVKPKTP